MDVFKNFEGAWVVDEMIDLRDGLGPCLTTRRYFGYSKDEAVAMFREEFAGKVRA